MFGPLYSNAEQCICICNCIYICVSLQISKVKNMKKKNTARKSSRDDCDDREI